MDYFTHCHFAHLSTESPVGAGVWLPRKNSLVAVHTCSTVNILKKEFDILIFCRLNKWQLMGLSL